MNIANHPLPFDELYRRIDMTTRIRYNAAHRFKMHQQWSQWVVTLISVVLIVVPLLQAMGVRTNGTPALLNAIEVFLAVLILAYTLLLGMENYAARAEKMLRCGLELGRLTREVYVYLGQNHQEDVYERFSNKYHDILEEFDNHDNIDYALYKINHPDIYYPKNWRYVCAWIITMCRYVLGFWHYACVSIGVFSTLYYVFVYQASPVTALLAS